MFLAGSEQNSAGSSVVAIVFERVGNGLWHDRMRREMHYRVNVVLRKKALQQVSVSGVTEHKFTAGNRGLETGAEVVQCDYRLIRLTELADHVAADVTGTAGNEYLFVLHNYFRVWSLRGRNIRSEKVQQRGQFFDLLRRIVVLRNDKDQKNGPLWRFRSSNTFYRADS